MAVIKVLLANHYNLQTATHRRVDLQAFIELTCTGGQLYER